MNNVNSIFDGLLGYEKLMLLCGFVLFVFALLAITVMIVQRRDFKAAVLLIVMAIMLMGFPGIQAIKFGKDMVELDRIRAQPAGTTDPAQKQQDQQTLSDLQQRAAGNPQLQAQVSDGYRAIGDVNRAYQLAQSVLRDRPSAAVRKILIPVLTAKLNAVRADAPANPIAVTHPTTASVTVPAPVDTSRQSEIATVAQQLQAQNGAVPLPADSRIALAKAYVVLGQPQKAQTNVEAALKMDPKLKLNPALLHAARAGSIPPPPER